VAAEVLLVLVPLHVLCADRVLDQFQSGERYERTKAPSSVLNEILSMFFFDKVTMNRQIRKVIRTCPSRWTRGAGYAPAPPGPLAARTLRPTHESAGDVAEERVDGAAEELHAEDGDEGDERQQHRVLDEVLPFFLTNEPTDELLP
jgi:hypothetical protein